MRMFLASAKSFSPPASASACMTVSGALQRDRARVIHLAHDVRRRGGRLDDDDGDGRVGDVFLERGPDPVAQLDRRPADRFDVADERQRDLAVGPDLHRLRELRVFVDLDPQLVARAHPVLRRDRRRLPNRGFLSASLRAAGASRRRPAAA